MNPLLLGFIVAMAIQYIMFMPAFFFKTDKLTDMSYGLSFIILALLSLKDFSLPKIILASMITAWGLRLSIFLFIRIRKINRDKRFDGVRENFFNFFGFWTLQGVSVFMIMICSLLFFDSDASFSLLSLIGFIIWLSGLMIEAIADYQKFTFTNKPENKGKWISSGLWKYSRHPNYFGEILCWIGIYIYSYSSLLGINTFLGLISPVFIAFLLIFVSGIPILEKQAEKKWGDDEKYLEYKKKTAVLIPFLY
jgi:steroid 5-alpha reductase family enzyme